MRYLLNICYLIGTFPDVEDAAVKRKKMKISLHWAYIPNEGERKQRREINAPSSMLDSN